MVRCSVDLSWSGSVYNGLLQDRSYLALAVSQPGHLIDRSDMLLKNSGLDRRLIQALADAGITDTRQLRAMSDRELLRLPGVADRSVEAIRAHFQWTR